MEVFVEQPLALNGYANNVCCLPVLCPRMRFTLLTTDYCRGY